MALIKWKKDQARVAPHAKNKGKNKRQSLAGNANNNPTMMQKSSETSGPETIEDTKAEEGDTTSTSKQANLFGIFARSFGPSSPSGSTLLGQAAQNQEDEEFYHERDVTEIEDPKYRPKWFIASPESGFRKTWDMVQALALIYIALLVPIRVGYDVNVSGWAYAFDFALESYFIVDFALNFVTGYENKEDHGKIVTDGGMIARNYARTWMVIDLLGILPVDLSLKISQGRFRCSFDEGGCPEQSEESNSAQLLKLFKLLRLFRLIKLLRLVRIGKLIERYQDDLFQLLPSLSILKLLGLLLFIGHLFGCFFFFFSTENFGSSLEADSDAWVVKEFGEEHEHASLVSKYIASMYWAFTTMTTVGYGDISAKTRGERIFAILGMIMGAFVYSGIIGSIGSVIQNMDLSHQAHRVKMDAVSTYVRERSLPKDLRKEMLLFFRVQKVAAYNESELLGEVPMDLRSNVIHYVYGKQMERCSLLRNCSKHFLTECFARMVPQTYISGTIIFRKGEYANSLYVIIKGKVEMLDHDTGKSVITFPEGSYFGEKAVIPPFRHDETMRARTTCKLLSITKEELDFILDQYEYDKNVLVGQALSRYRKVKEEFARHTKEANKRRTKRMVSRVGMRFKRMSMAGKAEEGQGDVSRAGEGEADMAREPEAAPAGGEGEGQAGAAALPGGLEEKLDLLARRMDDIWEMLREQKLEVKGLHRSKSMTKLK